MNRYTYKGKNIQNGEWVCGSLLKDSIYGCVIVSDWETVHEGVYDFWVKDNCAFEIIPETLCQCTGLQDIEGNYIFENDILPVNMYPDEHIENYYVVWDKNSACFDAINKDNTNYIISTAWNKYKIIGNKFDKEGDK